MDSGSIDWRLGQREAVIERSVALRFRPRERHSLWALLTSTSSANGASAENWGQLFTSRRNEMTGRSHRSCLALLCLVLSGMVSTISVATTSESYWPSWRGPTYNGTSPTAKPPLRWSETENVDWKVAIPGRGLASPIIWKDRIFLLTSVPVEPDRYDASRAAAAEKRRSNEWPPDVQPVEQRFEVLALSRDSAEIVWRKVAFEGAPTESHYIDSSWASGSPVTDGEVLVAHFGSNGTYAYDLDGTLLWAVDLGDMQTRNGFGEGSSPAIYRDMVIINWDHEGDSFIVALDKKSGNQIWKTDRPGEVTSWATPLVVEHGDRSQIIIPATGRSRGYDVDSGEEIWSLGGMTVNTIPSPVHRDGLVFLASGYRGEALQAVDLSSAAGDLEGSQSVVWTHDRHTPYVPSLLLYDDQIYFLKHFKNILTSVRADSGEVIFTEIRLDGISNVWASPVGAAGRVYIVGRGGTVVVVEHGETFRVLATNELDDRFDATPALVEDELYLRGSEYLYRISTSDE